ncbi:MAG TPA: glycosyltransferase family 9 protein [Xanthobacteraceae bacterium]|nr:glycosyltransferase family 9 protein [Xanthobacteraceae bacterium]
MALRRLGDVLLATPLIRSIRRAWPEAALDALVFADTAGILEGNPDVDRVIAMPARPAFAQSVAVAARLFKRYHLAVSTQSGDRPTFFTLLAGRTHAGPVWPGERIKRGLLGRPVAAETGVHRVEEMLRIADALGIPRIDEVVCPSGCPAPEPAAAGPYAVIHAAPKFRYKQWTRAGWRALADALRARGLAVFASGGPADREFLDALWRDAPEVRRLDGRLRWPELAALLAHARVYVGPDTSVTHLAAASGCQTVALFGPTDPRLWGPWPAHGLPRPWDAAGTIQRRHNVWLVQNPLPCLPCQQEGCERRLDSRAQCLDELTPAQVLTAIDEALSVPALGEVAP